MNGSQLAVGILGSRHTRLFQGLFLGNIPNQAGGFSCAILSDATLPKAVDWVPVPSSINIADTVGNAVTFLRLALRQTTRTFFSSQGTGDLFSNRRPKAETARVETVRETRLTTATGSSVEYLGFRSVTRDPWLIEARRPENRCKGTDLLVWLRVSIQHQDGQFGCHCFHNCPSGSCDVSIQGRPTGLPVLVDADPKCEQVSIQSHAAVPLACFFSVQARFLLCRSA